MTTNELADERSSHASQPYAHAMSIRRITTPRASQPDGKSRHTFNDVLTAGLREKTSANERCEMSQMFDVSNNVGIGAQYGPYKKETDADANLVYIDEIKDASQERHDIRCFRTKYDSSYFGPCYTSLKEAEDVLLKDGWTKIGAGYENVHMKRLPMPAQGKDIGIVTRNDRDLSYFHEGGYKPENWSLRTFERYDENELGEQIVIGTVCKIRGPITNQPDKMGEAEFGKIDWVLTDIDPMEGCEVKPRLLININKSSNGEVDIEDYDQLLPKFKSGKPAWKQIVNWSKESTSDHVPVIVSAIGYQDHSIKHFQMNLLANGLSSDGFVSFASSEKNENGNGNGMAIKRRNMMTIINVLKQKATERMKTYDGDAKKQRKQFVDDETDQGWRKMREKILKNDNNQQLPNTDGDATPMVYANSISELSEDMIFTRAAALANTIANEEPDFITLQENDMILALADPVICKAFVSKYTCLVTPPTDSDAGSDDDEVGGNTSVRHNTRTGKKAEKESLEELDGSDYSKILAITQQVEDYEALKRCRDTSTPEPPLSEQKRTLEKNGDIAVLLRKDGKGVDILNEYRKSKELLPVGYAIPDGVSVYVLKGRHSITSVEKLFIGPKNDTPAVIATVEGRFPARVISTHLTSGTKDTDIQARKTELQHLTAKIYELKRMDPDVPIILGMDANCEITDQEYANERFHLQKVLCTAY